MNDDGGPGFSRRKLLGFLGAGTAGLAGCSGIGGSGSGNGNGSDDGSEDDTSENGGDSTQTDNSENGGENGEQQSFDVSAAITQPGEGQGIVFDRSDNREQVLEFELETEAPTADYGVYVADETGGEVLYTAEEQSDTEIDEERAFTRELTWEEMNQNLEPGNHVLAVEGAVENQNGKKADQAHRSLTLEEYLEASFNHDSQETIRFGDRENQTENTEIEFTLDTNTGKVDYSLTIEGEEGKALETYSEEGVEADTISIPFNYPDLLDTVSPGEYTLKLTADTGQKTQIDTITIHIDQQGINLQENVQRRELSWKLVQDSDNSYDDSYAGHPTIIDSVAGEMKGGEEYLSAWNNYFEEVTGVGFAEDVQSMNLYTPTISGNIQHRQTYVVDGERDWHDMLGSENDFLFEVDIGGENISVYDFNTLDRVGFYLSGDDVEAADLEPSMGVVGWSRDEEDVRDMIEYIAEGGESGYESINWATSKPAQNRKVFQSAYNHPHGLIGGGYTKSGQIKNDTKGDGVGTLEVDDKGQVLERIYDSDNDWRDPEEYSRPEDTIEDMHPPGYGED